MNGIEQIFIKLYPAFFVTIVVILSRFLIAQIITSLFERGIISVGTKITLIRIIDTIVVFIIALAILQPFIESLVSYVIIVIFASMILILFYYEIKEFTAYISLQLIKYIKGRHLEIHLPNHSTPIYGKIVAIDPFSSTIEDVYGNRIYVANSLLINAIVKEHTPSVHLRVKLKRSSGDDPKQIIDTIVSSIRGRGTTTFRIHENHINIEKISTSEIVLRIKPTPLTTPVRLSDLARLLKELVNELKQYDPIIEIIEY